MTKKITVSAFFIILIVAGAFYYFYFLKPSVNDNAWRYVPNNAGLIFQVDNPKVFLSKFSKKNKIRTTLFQNENFKKRFEQIEKVAGILNHESFLSKIFDSPALISAQYDPSSKKTQWLFIFQADESINIEKFKNKVKNHYPVNFTDKNRKMLMVRFKNGNPDIFFRTEDNLLIFSTDRNIIQKSITLARSAKPHFSDNLSFARLKKTSGKNVDARAFIHYQQLPSLFRPLLSTSGKEALTWIGNFAQWAETDVMIKDDELLMSGFSYVSPDNYLSGFSSSGNEVIRAFGIIPFNTNLLIDLEHEDIKTLINQKNLAKLNKSFTPSIGKLMDVCGPEVAYAANATTKSSVSSNSWFLLRMKDHSKAKQYLIQIMALQTQDKAINFNGHIIRNLGIKNLVPQLFGKVFKTIGNSWYIILDDFIVFGNSAASLRNLLRFYESGKTLDMNENFKQFSDNLWDASNILFYLNSTGIKTSLPAYFNNEMLQVIEKNESLLSDFQGFSMQFSSSDSLFYTNFYSRVNKARKEENLALWKVQLDDEITGKPFLVRDHKTNTYNIIVFDIMSNIYLVSADGRVLWKKRLDALPKSNIYQVDYYKNGKIQYLFNTKDFIYLIDKNGNPVANYPRKLNPPATNGINVFDYNGKKDYRILVAQADKKIHNYLLNGKTVKGWNPPRMQNIVTVPVSRLLAGNKDYIIITDEKDNIRIVNRRGEIRINLKKNPDKAKNSSYYVNKTNSKGIIITTDKKGKLVYLSKKGGIKKTDFGTFSPDHFFLYNDFNGNQNKDFIYVDTNRLIVINRFKDVLFSYEFPSAITIKPVFFHLAKNQNVLGIVDSKEKTVFLFDKNGNTIISNGLVGENPFTVGSLNNNDEINLITSSGNTLLNYEIK